MDSRRVSRTVIDPKVRQVGFFTPNAEAPPGRIQSGPAIPAHSLSESPASNSLYPVMIPPSRHLSNTVVIRTAVVPMPDSALRRKESVDVPVGSYNLSESLLGTSSVSASPSSRVGDGLEFSDESSTRWYPRSGSGNMASSLPGGGFESAALKMPVEVPEKSGEPVTESHKELPANEEPLKSKTPKAERRTLQEAQRVVKAAAKGGETERGAKEKRK